MRLMNNFERVIAAITDAGRGLTDKEVGDLTGISPHAQVNQICNKLAKRGVTIREAGPEGTLVNRVIEGHGTVAVALGGSSQEQRAAEDLILEALGSRLGVELQPRRLVSPSGALIDVDGVAADGSVLVECWAHQGAAKVAQKYKLVNDAAKLQWASTWLEPTPTRLILCVTDEAAVKHLRGRSWQGQAIATMGVVIEVVELPQETITSIWEAQRRQFR